MKKPIFSKAFWIFLLIGFLACGFLFVMSILPLFDFETPETRLNTHKKWASLLSMGTLIAGLVLLLVANIAYLRENTKGFRFLVTGLFLAAFLYLDWTFLGNKAFSYQAKFVKVNLGDNFSIIWGYVFAGIAVLLCIGNWIMLFRRRKAKAEVASASEPKDVIVTEVSSTPTADTTITPEA